MPRALTSPELRNQDALYDYADEMAAEVLRVRGLEVGRDFGIDFMTVPDFAYYRYIKEKEDRDEGFAIALRLFLTGFGADEEKWIDPDVANIAGSKAILGLYEPEDRYVTITGNAAGLLEIVIGMSRLAGTNQDAKEKLSSRLMDLVSDIDRAKALSARQTLYHELVHAGQDWNFGMGDLKTMFAEEFDFAMAYKSVVEGDATFSSMFYLAQDFGVDEVISDDLMNMYLNMYDESVSDAAKVTVSPVTLFDDPLSIFYSNIGSFAYNYGMFYVAWLYLDGGFPAVDDAFMLPPATSRQILHPADGGFDVDVYDFGPSPVFESSSRLAELVNDENITMDTTLGEIGVNCLLASFGIYSFFEDASRGWAGDRMRMYTDSMMRNAAFWKISWDTEDDAARFFDAYRRIIQDKCSDPVDLFGGDGKSQKLENLCGTQFLRMDGAVVTLAELPWRLYDDEQAEVVDYIRSLEPETMTVEELSERLAERYLP